MVTDATSDAAKDFGSYSIQEKFGSALDAGFVVVPSALLLRQRELGLSDGELVVVLNILMAWREKEKLPFPRPATLAKRMGVQTRTVQRHLASLFKAKWVARVFNVEKQIYQYNLGKLVEKLQEIAPQILMKQVDAGDGSIKK